MQNLESVARGLAKIPGRKTVVFMSEGFFVAGRRAARIETVAAQAARSGITIYSIDGRGLINGLGANTDVCRSCAARAAAFDTGEDGPNILTADTGGFMVRNIDDMSRAFGRIVRDTSTYYVIGYQPDNTTMDGKVRKIEVKSSLPGVKVRARKSYAAVALPPQEAIWGFGNRGCWRQDGSGCADGPNAHRRPRQRSMLPATASAASLLLADARESASCQPGLSASA